jgi:hypothetical protein
MITQSWDDVHKYFGDVNKALQTDVTDAQNQIDQFMRHTTWVGANTFWQASLWGRRLIEMTGTSVYEWSKKVADYINYIKGLAASLQDVISGYQQQLMQLRGDQLGELNLWMQQETKKLEDQFKGELGKTKEYYDAKALLDELYAEKKKKILEEMAQVEDKTGSGKSGAGGIISSDFSTAQEYFQQLVPDYSKLIVQTQSAAESATASAKQIDINANFSVASSDPQYFARMFDDNIWPLFEKKLKLIGVTLK